MNQEFFKYIPLEVVIDILSRLPVRTIIHCKCVCKSWHDLLETQEFAKSHLSKSVPGLAVLQSDMHSSGSFIFFELKDGLDLEHHELHYNPDCSFDSDFPHAKVIQGSANGLLFLQNFGLSSNDLYICNPITRDYIQLQCPQEFHHSYLQVVTYGFGASKMTGQHKVVSIFNDYIEDQETYEVLELTRCHVYTLGTGAWKSIHPPGAPFKYNHYAISTFLNGNLHWLVYDLNRSLWISCFDLETEVFSTFSLPPLHEKSLGIFVADMCALGDCLCLCDNGSYDKIVIWLMKEYGVEKSWTKEFVISKIPDVDGNPYVFVHPIKVFKDGDILMAWANCWLAYYTNKTQRIEMVDISRLRCINAIIHIPSFLSLKSFGMENARSF